MTGSVDWESALQTWLSPFLARLGHPARRRMCPLYVAGLIGPGERKSLQPIAWRQPTTISCIISWPWDLGTRRRSKLNC